MENKENKDNNEKKANNDAGGYVMIRIVRTRDRDVIIENPDGRPKIITLTDINSIYLPVPVDEAERKRLGLDQIPEVQKYFSEQTKY